METMPMDVLACSVQDIEHMGADVYRLKMQLGQMPPQPHAAGQYLLLAGHCGEFYPFSIASAPQQLPELELHVQARDNAVVGLLQQLREQPLARVKFPQGEVKLDLHDPRPLLLIAAGTGLAQMHSIMEACRLQDSQVPIHLYWGARTEDDFYRVAAADSWRKMPNVCMHKIVSEDADWHGRSGLLYEAVCHDLPDLSGYRVFVSGSPNMVYATLDALVAAGLDEAQVQADAFSYAPRPSPSA